MPSIFSKIVAGDIPCYKIAETPNYFAFLDINPLKRGHTLVIPKREVDYIYDLDDETLSGLMAFSKQVARAIERAVPCERIGIAVIGLEVPHAHIHLVPLDNVHDINFANPKIALTADQMQSIAADIRSNLT